MAHKWYGTSRWKSKRASQLRREPLCAFCKAGGVLTPASVADHVEPHRGDYEMFWCGELQSLCKLCHDSTKKKLEFGYKNISYGSDGYPLEMPNQNKKTVKRNGIVLAYSKVKS